MGETFAAILESLRESPRFGSVARLYLGPATVALLTAEADRVVQVSGIEEPGNFFGGIPYTVAPNLDGWLFVDAEGNVVKAGRLAPSPTEKGERDG